MAEKTERVIEFTNYRNLGITALRGPDEPKTELLINTSIDINDLGGVIYIVGPNNSGKSNVLSGIKSFALNTISKTDRPDFLDIQDTNPTISFIVRSRDETYMQSKSLNLQSNEQGFKRTINLQSTSSKSDLPIDVITVAPENIKFFNQWASFAINRYSNYANLADLKLLKESTGTLPIRDWQKVINDVHNFLDSYVDPNYLGNNFNVSGSTARTILKSLVGKPIENDAVAFKNKYGYNLIPNVYTFQIKNFSQRQFMIQQEDFKNSEFFQYLFKAISLENQLISTAYEKFRANTTIGSLTQLAHKINSKLVKLAKVFNNLYHMDKLIYRFEIVLESSKIGFQIYIDHEEKSTPLNYDTQSTGFKWFFDFFFTLIAQSTLKPGDLILLDEPATNLHVAGIEELRKVIQDYAVENKIVFIITTHSPFFINNDYLEGVRTVYRVNEVAKINNKFHTAGTNESDTLKPIHKALTVGRHVLLNPMSKVVFVEGITDYCYLTAFKHHFSIDEKDFENLTFLPIGGLNDDTKKNVLKSDKELFDVMLSIHYKPQLLVDSDKPGQEAVKAVNDRYKGRISVTKISDIITTCSNIESLFHVDDRPALKTFNTAVNIKNNVNKTKWKQETLDNFHAVLKMCLVD